MTFDQSKVICNPEDLKKGSSYFASKSFSWLKSIVLDFDMRSLHVDHESLGIYTIGKDEDDKALKRGDFVLFYKFDMEEFRSMRRDYINNAINHHMQSIDQLAKIIADTKQNPFDIEYKYSSDIYYKTKE